MQKIVSIVPAPGKPGEPNKCNGSKVLMSDGQELHGVTALTIHGAAGEVWRADITVFAQPDRVDGVVAQIKEAGGEHLVVDGAIVIECSQQLSAEGIQWMREQLERAWPHRELVILPPGMRVSRDAQLDRIEQQLREITETMPRRPYYGGGPG